MRYRTGMIGELEAQQALEILEGREWVSEPGSCATRPTAAARAKRLIDYMQRIEPQGQFTSKTWPEGKRYRWAVRRKETP
jgi:hypothetical protein